ncbi:Uncharacterised protein [Streptococcus constellatus]|nr:Uncharacterised protein [Streptococcus constellatus]
MNFRFVALFFAIYPLKKRKMPFRSLKTTFQGILAKDLSPHAILVLSYFWKGLL